MKKTLVFLILLILFLTYQSCSVDKTSESVSLIENKSGVTVKIPPNTFLNDTLVLKNGDLKEIYRERVRGQSTFLIAYFLDSNPCEVIFDDSIHVIHYNDTLKHDGNFLISTNQRCLYNSNGYQKMYNSSKRESILNYTFTRQDYLDAQK